MPYAYGLENFTKQLLLSSVYYLSIIVGLVELLDNTRFFLERCSIKKCIQSCFFFFLHKKMHYNDFFI